MIGPKSWLETPKCERTSPPFGLWTHDAGLDEILGLCYAPEHGIAVSRAEDEHGVIYV